MDSGNPKIFAQIWSGWFRQLRQTLNNNIAATAAAGEAAFTGTVVLAKLSVANGSLTVVNGVITAYHAPT
jgi:hypothetical protein